jgi:hypothetical protein
MQVFVNFTTKRELQMSRLLAAILISAATITPLSAQAFGIPAIPGIGGASNNTGSTDLSGAQDQLVNQYISAGKSVLDGNTKMAEAVGLMDKAAASRAAGDTLTEGATKGALSEADKTSSDTSDAVAAALKNTDKMDGPAKEKFATGILSLAQGLVKYVGMKGSFDSFQRSLSSASPMMLTKLQSGAYIVTSFPSSVKHLSAALGNAVSYAKSHDISVPKDATDVLAKL